MAKAKESKKQLLGFDGKTSFESQTKAGIGVDFDMVALGALTYAIYTLGPKRTVDSFLGFWGNAIGTLGEGFAEGAKDTGEWVLDTVIARKIDTAWFEKWKEERGL